MFKAVWEKIYLAIQKVSAEGGYDIVWDKSVQPLVYVNAKYDVTVKVMQQLGIDADDLEKKQKEVIDADPRNKSLEEPRKQRSRRRSTSADTTGKDTAPTNTKTIESIEPRSPNNLPPAPPPPPVVPHKDPADTNKTRQEEVPR